MLTYRRQTYAIDTPARIERIFCYLYTVSTPLPVTEFHPEIDYSPRLDVENHYKYQMHLSMLQ